MKYGRQDRFHGRIEGAGRVCHAPGCDEAGEFRAPGPRASSFNGPGDYRWFCLDHVRDFNAGYDFFAGMSADEIMAAQSPLSGWEQESRAFRPTAGIDGAPRWADFADPLEAISARARARKAADTVKAQAAEEGHTRREELVAAARKDIETETRRSLEMIRKEVADLTVTATEKVTRKSLDAEDHRRLIQEALEETDFSALVPAEESNGGGR